MNEKVEVKGQGEQDKGGGGEELPSRKDGMKKVDRKKPIERIIANLSKEDVHRHGAKGTVGAV